MTRSLSARLAAALAVMLIAAGCGEGEPKTAPTPAPTSTPTPTQLTPPQAWVPATTLKPKTPAMLAQEAAVAARKLAAKIRKQNPLANRPWAAPREVADDGAWRAYQGSGGEQRTALARIAETPRAMWFGSWIGDGDIGQRVRDYIRDSQRGNPKALVQMAIFRMVPWEHAACGRNPSGGEAASYRRWIDSFAAAVGNTPTAIIMQPDGPFALCSPGGPTGGSSPTRLIAYATERLSRLQNTSVYIEIGASDWPAVGQGGVPQVLKFLVPMGVKYARGVALNGTHYTDTRDDIVRGAEVSQALERVGIRDKKVVINTANQGNPWEFGHYRGKGLADNAPVCRSVSDRSTCVALGIPPTYDVAHPRWGFAADINALALKYVDGFIWFGRPWLHMQNSPFDLGRALGLTRTWRWAGRQQGAAGKVR